MFFFALLQNYFKIYLTNQITLHFNMYTLCRYTFSNMFITESVDSFYSPKNETSKILRNIFFPSQIRHYKKLISSRSSLFLFFFFWHCVFTWPFIRISCAMQLCSYFCLNICPIILESLTWNDFLLLALVSKAKTKKQPTTNNKKPTDIVQILSPLSTAVGISCLWGAMQLVSQFIL